jgi:hypothetical protein
LFAQHGQSAFMAACCSGVMPAPGAWASAGGAGWAAATTAAINVIMSFLLKFE